MVGFIVEYVFKYVLKSFFGVCFIMWVFYGFNGFEDLVSIIVLGKLECFVWSWRVNFSSNVCVLLRDFEFLNNVLDEY